MKKDTTKKPGFFRQLTDEYRRSRSTFILFIILRVIVIAIGVRSVVLGNYEHTFMCALTLALFLLPPFLSKTFQIELPSLLEKIVLIFIFAAEILGEIGGYYEKYAIWDTLLHTTTGFIAAAVGLSLIDILNRSERISFNLSPIFVALTAFCFSMTIGVLWEFFEFGADVILQTDMQKDTVLTSISSVMINRDAVNEARIISHITDTAVNGQSLHINGYLDIGLFDTMKDLFVNFIGAAVFSVVGYFYTKYMGKNKSAGIVEGLRIKRKAKKEQV